MTPSQLAAAHDANMVAFFRLTARLLPTSSQATYGAIPVVVTGVPVPFFNGAWLLEPSSPEDVAAALNHLRGSGMPFVVHLRSDLADGHRMLEPSGLKPDGLLPCFALTPREIPPAPAGLEFRRVGPDEWEDLIATTAAGFGMPRELVEALYARAMIDEPAVRAFVGYADGQPVVTSISGRNENTVGIYSVATVPDARGHGYGTAATWHLLRDADPGWEVAVLQASEMGRPIYERMGFELVRELEEYVAQPSA